jgi:hypothetical protein
MQVRHEYAQSSGCYYSTSCHLTFSEARRIIKPRNDPLIPHKLTTDFLAFIQRELADTPDAPKTCKWLVTMDLDGFVLELYDKDIVARFVLEFS